MSFKQILIRSANWIGDAVMTTPAVTGLAELYPGARITVLARSWVAPVFAGHPAVSEVVTDNAGTRPWAGSMLRRALALRGRGFDLAVMLPNSFESALVPFLARIPRRIGYAADARSILLTDPVPAPEDKGERHEVYYYLGLVDYLRGVHGFGSGVAGLAAPSLFLDVPEEGAQGAAHIVSSLGVEKNILIGFNPGAAYGPAKCWPWERFVSLGKALIKDSVSRRILIFGTKKEEPVAEKIRVGIGEKACNLAGKTTLSEAMGLIRMLGLLVTNDSGLMHVGAALGTRLVAIFGSTNPVATGPWSKGAVVIRHGLKCSPCLKRTCPGGFECMTGIGVEEVMDACEKGLSDL
ncbi:MAG: lipopolysaccharide heptosyltransferase II [Desulfobacteraceae bacterium]|nr:lipopolysaccharide heptosyltransferase II [Desulfobacteraceae bacterium]